jgi:hypothetical protein
LPLKQRILKLNPNTGGYLMVGLLRGGKRKGYLVHVLVAMAFLGHEPNGHNMVVDHIDNDKLNNKLENLQVITQRENLSKDRVGYSSKYVGVCWVKRENVWKASIYINGERKHLGYFKISIVFRFRTGVLNIQKVKKFSE